MAKRSFKRFLQRWLGITALNDAVFGAEGATTEAPTSWEAKTDMWPEITSDSQPLVPVDSVTKGYEQR